MTGNNNIPAPERSKEETVGLCISAIQAERDKPIEGPEHGAWDRGRRDGLTKAIKILSALETDPTMEFERLYAAPAPVPVTITDRPEVNSEREILERLAAGDEIAYSQDGDDAFFTKGDRAFVGPAIIGMRSKGYLKRIVLDPENYRGGAERDVISDAGRAALSQKPGEQG